MAPCRVCPADEGVRSSFDWSCCHLLAQNGVREWQRYDLGFGGLRCSLDRRLEIDEGVYSSISPQTGADLVDGVWRNTFLSRTLLIVLY